MNELSKFQCIYIAMSDDQYCLAATTVATWNYKIKAPWVMGIG